MELLFKMLVGFFLIMPISLAAYLLGKVNLIGFLASIGIGILVFVSMGWQGFFVLFCSLFLGSAVYDFGHQTRGEIFVDFDKFDKFDKNFAQYRANRIVANSLISLFLALFGFFFQGQVGTLPRWLNIGFVASLATAVAQIFSSEMGQIYGKHPVILPSFRPVPIGTPGGVSVEGTFFGIVSAIVIGTIGAVFLDPFGGLGIMITGIAATTAILADRFMRTRQTSKKTTEVFDLITTMTGTFLAIALSISF